MRYVVTLDVPDLDAGIRFYGRVFGFAVVARPVEGYAVLTAGDSQIGLMQRQEGTRPAKGSPDVRRYARHWTPVHMDFHVPDFAATLARALHEGAVCEEKFESATRPPVAFCSDPFGHGFCLIGERVAPPGPAV